MSDKCNCYRFSPRDSLSGAVAQIADYLSKHPGWNETELRAFVDGLIIHTGVESFNGRTGNVILDKNDVNNLKIASAYFAEGGESIDSLDLVSLYNNGVRFVFTDFNNETKSYNLSFVLDYSSDSGNVVYYPISADSTSGGNVISVNGKTGQVELKVVDVSNGNSSDKNAYIFIDEAEDYPDIVAPDSNKLGGQNPSYYATTESVSAITPDDTVVDGKPWTSKKIVDSLCMPLEATGNPVTVYPVENYPLGVKVSWEPTQAGSGDPSPDNIRPISGRNKVSVTRCGKNLSQSNAFGNVAWASTDAKTTKLINSLLAGTYTISFTITLTSFSDRFTSDTAAAKGLYAVYSVYDGSVSYGKQSYIGTAQNIYRTDALPKSVNVSATLVINEADAKFEKEIYFYGCGRDTPLEGAPNGALGTAEVSNLQIELSSATTPYEPYTGSTTDIALPETVYGGTLDAETGVVTVDRVCKTLTGNEELILTGNNPYFVVYSFLIGNDGTLKNAGGKCSHFPVGFISSSDTNQCIAGYNEALYVRYDALFDSVDSLKSYLSAQHAAGAPVQVCYKLAIPATIQLTPHQIAALSGVNTLYTDAGTLTVTGREDPRHTIVELKNAIISLGGNI